MLNWILLDLFYFGAQWIKLLRADFSSIRTRQNMELLWWNEEKN